MLLLLPLCVRAAPIMSLRELEARALVQQAIAAAKLGNAKSHFPCRGDYIEPHNRLLAWAATTTGAYYTKGSYCEFDERRACVVLAERKEQQYRTVFFFVDTKDKCLYYFCNPPWTEKVMVDRILQDPIQFMP